MADAATIEAPARRGKARPARRDGAAKALGVPYIVRGIPTYDVLSEENLQKIERAADRILAEVGIEFRDDPAAIDHWKAHGLDLTPILAVAPCRRASAARSSR